MEGLSVIEADDGTLRLQGELTIYQAVELRERLLGAVAAGGVRLDLTRVADLDTAGLQLLLALRLAAQRGGLPFDVTGMGPVVRDVLSVVGLDRALDGEG